MQDQVILRVQGPGGPNIAINVARLIDPANGKSVINFAALNDYAVSLDLATVAPGAYRLAVKTPDHPMLIFSTNIAGGSDRTFDFAAPAPKCATISVQQVSVGASASRRIHMVLLALSPKHEEVVLVAGADLKGDTRYVKFARTWRDDLYYGRTDLGSELDQQIPRGIHDHTVVSIFDFRTGYLERQIKGVDGWHTMYRVLQGSVPPDIKDPKANDALERRQAADSISILDVYRHISDLGSACRGCVRQLHFFSHSYLRGPVLLNTYDSNEDISDLRDPTDKDARTKDFLPANLAQYSSLPDAFDPGTHVKNWGCFSSEMADELRAVARTKTLDQEVVVKKKNNKEKIYSSADAIRDLKMHIFPESYMVAFCRELNVDGWSLPPGTTSTYKTSSKYHYFHMQLPKHSGVIKWWERYFGVQPDLGGAVSFRKLL